MELKPAGPERDRQIAELRGEVETGGHPNHPIWERRHPNDEGLPAYSRPLAPYSTDISAAMELWEEMKGASPRLEMIANDKGRFIVIRNYGIKLSRKIGNEYAAVTEADAISGAYVKWRTS